MATQRWNEEKQTWDLIERRTFSAMWSEALEKALKQMAVEPFPLECHRHSADFKALAQAVGQGIDSHLEAIFFTEMDGTCGRRRFVIKPESVPVLVRRLMEDCSANNPDDDAALSLAISICSCFDIELI